MALVLKRINCKLLTFVLMFIAFLTGVLNITAYADEIYDDTGYYNNYNWTKIEVDLWVKYESLVFGLVDRTNCYIRITDHDGNPIDSLNRLAVKYMIGDKEYTIEKDITNNNGNFTFGNVLSKEGQFSSRNLPKDYTQDDYLIDLFKNEDVPYTEHANYSWIWNYYISEIVYMYAWYTDMTTGEEVAGSFFPNGEHPLFDDDGELIGIYDSNNNLLSNTSLDESGMIVEVNPITGVKTPLLESDSQMNGIVDERGNNFVDKVQESITNFYTNLSIGLRWLTIIGSIIVAFVISMAIIKFIVYIKMLLPRKSR